MRYWWGSIEEMVAKIKTQGGEWRDRGYLVPVIFILTVLTAFGLGRLSALEEKRPPVRITGEEVGAAIVAQDTAEQSQNTISAIPDGGKIVASKNGTKYHYPWCAGALAMNEENKVWFDNIEEARAAGYTPAGNCAGLE